jgi:hypothetical protein
MWIRRVKELLTSGMTVTTETMGCRHIPCPGLNHPSQAAVVSLAHTRASSDEPCAGQQRTASQPPFSCTASLLQSCRSVVAALRPVLEVTCLFA